MKLRNKKTGEINCGDLHLDEFDSLAELNEEWEDYKEPKKCWAIEFFGEITEVTNLSRLQIETLRRYGNLFETKEEAEKAVEKLKAWKRLKDKNFQFHGYNALGLGEITFSLDFENMDDEGEIGELQHDLDLLFGGEE